MCEHCRAILASGRLALAGREQRRVQLEDHTGADPALIALVPREMRALVDAIDLAGMRGPLSAEQRVLRDYLLEALAAAPAETTR